MKKNARCAEMTALESDEVGDTEEMLECDTQNNRSRSVKMTSQEVPK